MTSQILHVALMLILTVGFFIGLMFLVKYLKRLGPKLSTSVQILGGASVSHKAKVVMIQSENKKILLGVTDTQISKLHVFEDKAEFKENLDAAKQETLCSD